MRLKEIQTIIIDIISFNKPQAIFINLSSIILLLSIIPTQKLIYSPFRCIFREFLLPLIFKGNCPVSGIFADCRCPACGLTHALSRLLHGDLIGAWNYNPLVFVLFAAILIVLIINLAKSIKYYKKTKKIYPF